MGIRHQQQKDLFAMTEDSESGMMQSMVHREKKHMHMHIPMGRLARRYLLSKSIPNAAHVHAFLSPRSR